ncbi:MAG TPA: L-seryl-tRNA(Sec) selenium transferase [Thermoanaerobaculia bacterium]|nr:L-seryl-tRNA(Sec) selenium transferase [Thermoanaerobaculia bacterium]
MSHKTAEDQPAHPPSMDSLLTSEAAADAIRLFGRETLKQELRRAIARGHVSPEALIASARDALSRHFSPSLTRAINATGVLLHTNLGRAPLCPEAREALREVSGGYSTLEYDAEKGERGKRQDHVRALACDLFGAPGALAVNNNAAALLLAMTALARGRRVLVSRGELVAIGGSFKIPEILEASGASLAEVGTTNRTTIDDYRRSLGPEVALLLTVHPSNYEIRGYTARPEPGELALFAREAGIPWLHDQGTGCVEPLDDFGIAGEPTVAQCLADGADLVTFSGDKLLCGPQVGLVVGRKDLIALLAAHPVARAVRPDKLTLAALAATLAAWKRTGRDGFPVYRAATAAIVELEQRGARIASLAGANRELGVAVAPSEALFGGGTSPEKRFPSRALRVSHSRLAAEELASRLRQRKTPIVGRVETGHLWLDLRTISPEEDGEVGAALSELR